MSRFILLDSGPLGMLTNPKATPLCEECRLWFTTLASKNYEVILPEITDYEVRRELLRAGKIASVRQLDLLKTLIPYLPISTETMLKAAELWAPVSTLKKANRRPKRT